jgi:hypothetical protein
VPFCTFGTSGLETSTEALRKALPKAKVVEGFGLRKARIAEAEKEVDQFLKAKSYKKD